MPRPREKRCLLRRAGDRRTHGVPTELGESHFRKTFPTVTYNQTHCIPTRLPTFPASTSTDTSLGGTSSPAAQAFFYSALHTRLSGILLASRLLCFTCIGVLCCALDGS